MGRSHSLRGQRRSQRHAPKGFTRRFVEPTAGAQVHDADLRAALRAGAITVNEAAAAMRRRRAASA